MGAMGNQAGVGVACNVLIAGCPVLHTAFLIATGNDLDCRKPF